MKKLSKSEVPQEEQVDNIILSNPEKIRKMILYYRKHRKDCVKEEERA